MLSWDEIVLLNKRLSSHSFLKFLNEAKVLPGVITIE
jgi:chromate transport protein ChrA